MLWRSILSVKQRRVSLAFSIADKEDESFDCYICIILPLSIDVCTECVSTCWESSGSSLFDSTIAQYCTRSPTLDKLVQRSITIRVSAVVLVSVVLSQSHYSPTISLANTQVWVHNEACCIVWVIV